MHVNQKSGKNAGFLLFKNLVGLSSFFLLIISGFATYQGGNISSRLRPVRYPSLKPPLTGSVKPRYAPQKKGGCRMKIESSNLQPQWWACDASTNVKMSNTKTNFEGSQEAKTTERNKVYIPIYRVSLVREKSLKAEYKYVKNPLSVYQIIKPYLDDLDREHFVVMMLDVKKKVIGINTVAVGILSSCPVHPREVFKPVIVANAAAVILVHNHRQSGAQPG
jgi:hypothetical protein